MSARRGVRRTAALLTGAAAAVTAVPVFLAGPATAATTANVTFACTTLGNSFNWNAEVTASAVGDGTDVGLTLEFTDLPGIAPVPINDQNMTGVVNAEIDGTAAELTGSGKVSAAPNAPVQVVPVTGSVASSATSIEVVIGHAEFTVAGVVTSCDAADGAAIGAVEVDAGEVPTPQPTPSPSPTEEPTKPPKDPDDGGENKDAVPAKGKVTFDCVFEPLGSPFKWTPTVAVYGSRATANDANVELWATMTDQPGLSPVPIENNQMKVSLPATVGGDDVDLTGTSTVNAAANAKVPVPKLESSTSNKEDELAVEVGDFTADFSEVSGLDPLIDCKVTSGADLGTLTVGIGAQDDDPADDDPAAAAPAPGDAGTLPKTGSGAPLTVVALWAGALTLIGAAVVMLLPKRRSEH